MGGGEAEVDEMLGEGGGAGTNGESQAEGLFGGLDGEDGVDEQPEVGGCWRRCLGGRSGGDGHGGRATCTTPYCIVGAIWTVAGFEMLWFGKDKRQIVKGFWQWLCCGAVDRDELIDIVSIGPNSQHAIGSLVGIWEFDQDVAGCRIVSEAPWWL